MDFSLWNPYHGNYNTMLSMFFKNINQIQYHVHHVYPYPLSGMPGYKEKEVMRRSWTSNEWSHKISHRKVD